MEKSRHRTEISCLPRGNGGFGNFLNVNFVRHKIDSPREHYISLPLGKGKCCYSLGKVRKHI